MLNRKHPAYKNAAMLRPQVAKQEDTEQRLKRLTGKKMPKGGDK